jgi:hypothetical protein
MNNGNESNGYGNKGGGDVDGNNMRDGDGNKGWGATKIAMARAARAMMTATKRAMATVAKVMATQQRGQRQWLERAMSMMARAMGDSNKEGDGKGEGRKRFGDGDYGGMRQRG